MSPYYHLFYQEQPGVFHQICQMRLNLVIIKVYSNCWRTLILANKCTWWLVYSALVYLMVYHISKVCLELVYIQHNHVVYGELHIYPYLFLDQNAYDNAYSTSLRHEVWNMDHKMILLGIHSHMFLFNVSIILNMILSFCPFYLHESFLGFSWSMTTSLWYFFVRCSWNSLAKHTSYFWVPVCILICETNIFNTGSWTVYINWYM